MRRIKVILFLWIFVFMDVYLAWPDEWNVELVGSEPLGPPLDVWVVDNYAYLCAGAALVILDVSEPSQPTEVGRCPTFSLARAVQVRGRYAYVANDALQVIDISNPRDPHEVGFYDTPGIANRICVSGNYAYVADFRSGIGVDNSGLQVIDISDPTSPQRVNSYITPSAGILVNENRAYLASGDLSILDVTDPKNLRQIAFYGTSISAVEVQVVEGYAYVADSNAGLKVINVAGPGNPRLVSSYPANGAWDIQMLGNYVYLIVSQKSGYWDPASTFLWVIDITDPTQLRQIGSLEIPGARGVYVASGYAYVVDYNDGLRIIDISDPTHPKEVGLYITPGPAKEVSVARGYAYVLDGYRGLRVMDVSNPRAPHEIGIYEIPDGANDIEIVNDYAFIASTNSLRVIDISNPRHPSEVTSCFIEGESIGIDVVGSYAYVACSYIHIDDPWERDEGRLHIVDVSLPTDPFWVSSYKFVGIPAKGFADKDGAARAVQVAGQYAYVATGYEGLQVIDVSNPAHPKKQAGYNWNIEGFVDKVSLAGNYAYLVGSGHLRIVDISDLKRIFGLSSYVADASIHDIDIAAGIVYVASGSLWKNGLQVINVFQPSNPFKVGFYDTSGGALGICLSGGRVYLADGSAGLKILKFKGATEELITPLITSVALEGGNISPRGGLVVQQGADQTFMITPNLGYGVTDVLVDGVSVGAVNTYTFSKVGCNHIIEAIFTVNTYTIAVKQGVKGTVSPSGEVLVQHGASQKFIIKPDANYGIIDVKVDGKSMGLVTEYTFENVVSNHILEATFTAVTGEDSEKEAIDPQDKALVTWAKVKTYKFTLGQNYPNPFNPETWIPFELAEGSEAEIRIYDSLGKLIRVLDLGFKEPGWYLSPNEAALWDGTDLNGERVSSGVYFYTLQAGRHAASRKMVLLK